MRKLSPLIFLFIVSCTSIQIPAQEKQYLKSIFEPEGNNVTKYKPVENTGEFLTNILNLQEILIDSLNYEQIELRQVNNKIIEIKSTYKGKEYLAVLRGRFKGKEFKIKNKFETNGVPPIAWALKNTSTSLIKSNDGTLIFYQHHGGVVLLILIPVFATSNGPNKYVFRLIN